MEEEEEKEEEEESTDGAGEMAVKRDSFKAPLKIPPLFLIFDVSVGGASCDT